MKTKWYEWKLQKKLELWIFKVESINQTNFNVNLVVWGNELDKLINETKTPKMQSMIDDMRPRGAARLLIGKK